MAVATIEHPSIPQLRQHLVGPRADGWLTGWLSVLLWVMAWVGGRFGHPLGSLGIPFYWPALVLSALHFGTTYHLAYSGGTDAIRKRPFALAIGPAVLGLALASIVVFTILAGSRQTRRATQIAIVSVFLLTTWHYIKQVYGVARIGASYRKIVLTKPEVRVLRYGLYPLWLIGAGQVLARGSGARYAGFDIGVDLLPNGIFAAARVAAILCATAIAVVIGRASMRCRVLPPSLVVAPYIAAFLWLAAPTNYFGATIALGALHALQYMACCHRAEAAFGLAPLTRRSMLRWAEIFGGAACGGLIISLWLPQRLNATVHVAGAPLLFTAVCFVFLNLHHYLIDAVIWRSTGDLVRAMNRRPSPA